MICFPNYSCHVNRAFVTSVYFFCVQCSAASHATQGQRSAVTSQGDPLKEMWEVKGKIVFIVPLVGLSVATRADHHCHDWGGKLLTSARSCTAEPLWVYVSLILIRSCCWNFVSMIAFIKLEIHRKHQSLKCVLPKCKNMLK